MFRPSKDSQIRVCDGRSNVNQTRAHTRKATLMSRSTQTFHGSIKDDAPSAVAKDFLEIAQ